MLGLNTGLQYFMENLPHIFLYIIYQSISIYHLSLSVCLSIYVLSIIYLTKIYLYLEIFFIFFLM